MDEFLKVWPTIKWNNQPPTNYGVMLAIVVSGGQRSGELRALRWKHVSWENNGIAVVKAIKYKNEEGRPKQNSVRAVLLPQRTMDLLRWRMSQTTKIDPDDDIFPQRNGRNILLQFKAAMDRATPTLR